MNFGLRIILGVLCVHMWKLFFVASVEWENCEKGVRKFRNENNDFPQQFRDVQKSII